MGTDRGILDVNNITVGSIKLLWVHQRFFFLCFGSPFIDQSPQINKLKLNYLPSLGQAAKFRLLIIVGNKLEPKKIKLFIKGRAYQKESRNTCFLSFSLSQRVRLHNWRYYKFKFLYTLKFNKTYKNQFNFAQHK
jgi:hypothetical protein